MADHSAIEWTDATWNPVTGCSVVSPGCTNCYAMRLAGTRLAHLPSRAGLTRASKAGPVWTGEVRLNVEWLTQPLRWRRPRRIFVCAHGDLFAEGVPDEWIDRVFAIMGLAHWHSFQVLTKRPARMREYLTDRCVTDRIGARQRAIDPRASAYENAGMDAPWPLPNVWIGVSVEDQTRADDRIPHLLATPAAVRFVSAEPLLEPVQFSAIAPTHDDYATNALRGYVHDMGAPIADAPAKLDWIIVGGESGPGARPMHPDWVRAIRDQCAAARVLFFFKQWGSYSLHEIAPDGRVEPPVEATPSAMRWRRWDNGVFRGPAHKEPVARFLAPGIIASPVGKARAGRTLDGRTHDDMPGRTA